MLTYVEKKKKRVYEDEPTRPNVVHFAIVRCKSVRAGALAGDNDLLYKRGCFLEYLCCIPFYLRPFLLGSPVGKFSMVRDTGALAKFNNSTIRPCGLELIGCNVNLVQFQWPRTLLYVLPIVNDLRCHYGDAGRRCKRFRQGRTCCNVDLEQIALAKYHGDLRFFFPLHLLCERNTLVDASGRGRNACIVDTRYPIPVRV